jgi:hypothetical protein
VCGGIFALLVNPGKPLEAIERVQTGF